MEVTGLAELLAKRGTEIDNLRQVVFGLERQLESVTVKSTSEATCLQNSIRTKEEEIRQLQASCSQLKRDFDQKLQQTRMKYEEHLLEVTSARRS